MSLNGQGIKQKTGAHTYLSQCANRKIKQYYGNKGHRQVLANKPDIITENKR